MIDLRVGLVLAFSALFPPVGHAMNACKDRADSAYSFVKPVLPPSDARRLQSILDQEGAVQLVAGGDYRKAGTIYLSSNMRLIGFAGSRLERVVIPGGTANAELRGVTVSTLEFPPSEKITAGNCFANISGTIQATSSYIENNDFVDLFYTSLDINLANHGTFRGNRFVRFWSHSASPQIRIAGNSPSSVAGNVFIATTLLYPHGDSVVLRSVQDIRFLGINAESWNSRKKSKNRFLIKAEGVESARIVHLLAGDWANKAGGIVDFSGQSLEIRGLKKVGPIGPRAINIGDRSSHVSIYSMNGSGLDDIEAQLPDNAIVLRERGGVPRRMTSSDRHKDLAVQPATLSSLPSEWEMPRLVLPSFDGKQLPKPWGDDDVSGRIQALIDKQGVAVLPEGEFRISKSLRLRNGQGLVGAGQMRTRIMGLSNDLALIVGGDDYRTKRQTTFFLSDITLTDGGVGILHSNETSGAGAQYVNTRISHVTISKMTRAGILINGIYGWDNNFIENLRIMDCGAGIEQRVAENYRGPVLSGDVEGMTYLDKNVCFRCSFIRNGIALKLLASRQNNSNYFINSQFIENERILEQVNSESTILIGSLLIANGGEPSIQTDRELALIGSVFEGGSQTSVVFDGPILCDGCQFHKGTSKGMKLFSPDSRYFFFNSSAEGISIDSGIEVFTNSSH